MYKRQHYYRAEIQRSNVWRSRLDTTTNWAVVTVAASITFVFAAPENHWGVFLLVMLLVMLFLFIEARRYRYYELWSLRARLMETCLLYTSTQAAFHGGLAVLT